ncbi:ankyrin repeat-containing protein NPR4-like [Arachis duranensis]|uniref:Ankyrin repeat-containing protein NPR4-like n=1 Tax=Arachis duranensis TaxID=130453 RepID=A0A9C6U044_ARADU|nr:ankyrin repeat-containing protein NPR4-like [Arachis duranensis]
MKKTHLRVDQILSCLGKKVTRLDGSQLRNASAYDAMLQAAKYGTIEFIELMKKANPDLLWATDRNKRGIFAHAILNRKKNVFDLIHDVHGRKEIVLSRTDVFGNNLLHLAARLGPSSALADRSGAALQMQSEIQWFKAVEEIVHPKCKEAKNEDGKKPHEIFMEQHKELAKEGEKWAKDTAGAFSIVGTLITTILFAAAFTLPGGNNQHNGEPMFLHDWAFNVFIVADAISLFASSTSVLIFIGILTSRYTEIDFLQVLPWKLLAALVALFLSVVCMMVAFCAALLAMLKGKAYHPLLIGAIVLASIPIIVFIPSQLRLFVEIFDSTTMSNNNAGKKPDEVFKEQHQELAKAWEKWVKDTAGAFTIVGTLITTILFAATRTPACPCSCLTRHLPSSLWQMQYHCLLLRREGEATMIIVAPPPCKPQML